MFHTSNRKPEVRQDGTSVEGIAVTDLLCFRKDCGRILELCARKSTKCWEFTVGCSVLAWKIGILKAVMRM